jgi:hypothetical protein
MPSVDYKTCIGQEIRAMDEGIRAMDQLIWQRTEKRAMDID